MANGERKGKGNRKMHKVKNFEVTPQMVYDQSELKFLASQEAGNFEYVRTIIENGVEFSVASFDRKGTRFKIQLMGPSEADRAGYVISVINFHVCYQTSVPHNIAYKFTELGLPRIDAESIEMAVRQMMKFIVEAEEEQKSA